MKVLRKIVDKTKVRQNNINEWVERRREWDQHVTRMDKDALKEYEAT